MWAYALIFVLTAGETSAFIGLVLPSETVVLFAAALSSRGVLNPFLLALAVIAGGIVGDSTGYWVGRLFGKRLDTPREGRRCRPGGRVDRAAGYLRRRGGPAVFTGRFIGFVRSFVPFTAGAARMPYRSFLGYSAAASLTWGPLNVAAGYFLGASASRLLRTAGLAGLIAVGVLVLVLAGVLAWRRHRAQSAAAAEPSTDTPTEPAAPAPPATPTETTAPTATAEPQTDPQQDQPHPERPHRATGVPGPANPSTHSLAGHGSPDRRG
jgi:membrane-associated protein